MAERQPLMPSEVSDEVGTFDRFAAAASRIASRAYFFAACVLLVLIWAPTYFLFGSVDTWQLIINTATTIITFLIVALVQNSQTRADMAGSTSSTPSPTRADLMEHLDDDTDSRDLMRDRAELRKAFGLEGHESTTHNAVRRRDAVSR